MAVVCCVKEVPEIVAVTMLIELISLFFNRITRVHILLMLLETFQNHLKMICKCIVSWGSSGDY
jgi:cytochrome bd-type quinol oxidase subunit 1